MAEADAKRPEVPLVNVQIDGEWHQFPKGTRMIEACRLAGKQIPHYCYHPKLSSPGNCRMCLVQMGMPPALPRGKPQAGRQRLRAHRLDPAPGRSPAPTRFRKTWASAPDSPSTKCREGVMEFLLINHPLDCPICDQAGECRLQEHSVEHGRGVSPLRGHEGEKAEKRRYRPAHPARRRALHHVQPLHPLHGRSGRDPVLGFTQRGTHTTLTVHPGRLLDSNYSLNTADICPVGALTSNDFRFQDAGLVPQGNPDHRRQLRHRHQHHRLDPGTRSTASPRAKTTR